MNVIEVIPFTTFRERLEIVKQETSKGRYVEVHKDYIYSAERWKEKGDKD